MSTKEDFEVKKVRRRFSLGGYAFIALTLYGIFFLVSGISHLSQVLSASTGAGEKFWWIAKGLSIILVLFITFRVVKYYRKPAKAKGMGATVSGTASESYTPPFFSPLLTGLIWPGLPVLAVFGAIAYAIAPSLVQEPSMLMVPPGATALYYALRSAAWRSRISTLQGKVEMNSGLTSIRSAVGSITLIIWLIAGYYGYTAPPGTFTETMKSGQLSGFGEKLAMAQKEKRELDISVSQEHLPGTLLDRQISTGEAKEWIVIFNISNPHIANGGALSEILLESAKPKNRLRFTEKSYLSDNKVHLTVNMGAGEDGISLTGDCLPPKKESGGNYIPKTCAGNWRTLQNSIAGVFSLVFKGSEPNFTVYLSEGPNLKEGGGDARLIAYKKE